MDEGKKVGRGGGGVVAWSGETKTVYGPKTLHNDKKEREIVVVVVGTAVVIVVVEQTVRTQPRSKTTRPG